jgi:Tfp pilus assembly protein PilV
MRIARPKLRQRRGDKGFGLIELLMAMIVLVVGMMGGMIIVLVAINSNTRSKNDTTATALAQSVMEKILSVPTGTNATMLDCVKSSSAGAPFPINTAVGGATVLTSVGTLPTYVGAIDFSQDSASVPAGYQMNYQVCGTGGSVSTYDVRWNVANGPTAGTKVITVAAKNTVMRTKSGVTAAGQLFLFPITLRTLKGN